MVSVSLATAPGQPKLVSLAPLKSCPSIQISVNSLVFSGKGLIILLFYPKVQANGIKGGSNISFHSQDTQSKKKQKQIGLSQPNLHLNLYLSLYKTILSYINHRLSQHASPQDPLLITQEGRYLLLAPPSSPKSLQPLPDKESWTTSSKFSAAGLPKLITATSKATSVTSS